VIEWGCYQYKVMPFELKNSPTLFSRVVVATFKEFIHNLSEVYLNDRRMFILLKDHIEIMFLVLDRCRHFQISLNFKNFLLCVSFGNLLGHAVCKKGVLVDPTKIVVIVDLTPLTSV
jgi:hypothetical protein